MDIDHLIDGLIEQTPERTEDYLLIKEAAPLIQERVLQSNIQKRVSPLLPHPLLYVYADVLPFAEYTLPHAPANLQSEATVLTLRILNGDLQ